MVDVSASHTLRYIGPSGDLAKNEEPDSEILGRGLRFCFSNKPTGDAAAGAQTALGVARVQDPKGRFANANILNCQFFWHPDISTFRGTTPWSDSG